MLLVKLKLFLAILPLTLASITSAQRTDSYSNEVALRSPILRRPTMTTLAPHHDTSSRPLPEKNAIAPAQHPNEEGGEDDDDQMVPDSPDESPDGVAAAGKELQEIRKRMREDGTLKMRRAAEIASRIDSLNSQLTKLKDVRSRAYALEAAAADFHRSEASVKATELALASLKNEMETARKIAGVHEIEAEMKPQIDGVDEETPLEEDVAHDLDEELEDARLKDEEIEAEKLKVAASGDANPELKYDVEKSPEENAEEAKIQTAVAESEDSCDAAKRVMAIAKENLSRMGEVWSDVEGKHAQKKESLESGLHHQERAESSVKAAEDAVEAINKVNADVENRLEGVEAIAASGLAQTQVAEASQSSDVHDEMAVAEEVSSRAEAEAKRSLDDASNSQESANAAVRYANVIEDEGNHAQQLHKTAMGNLQLAMDEIEAGRACPGLRDDIAIMKTEADTYLEEINDAVAKNSEDGDQANALKEHSLRVAKESAAVTKEAECEEAHEANFERRYSDVTGASLRRVPHECASDVCEDEDPCASEPGCEENVIEKRRQEEEGDPCDAILEEAGSDFFENIRDLMALSRSLEDFINAYIYSEDVEVVSDERKHSLGDWMRSNGESPMSWINELSKILASWDDSKSSVVMLMFGLIHLLESYAAKDRLVATKEGKRLFESVDVDKAHLVEFVEFVCALMTLSMYSVPVVDGFASMLGVLWLANMKLIGTLQKLATALRGESMALTDTVKSVEQKGKDLKEGMIEVWAYYVERCRKEEYYLPANDLLALYSMGHLILYEYVVTFSHENTSVASGVQGREVESKLKFMKSCNLGIPPSGKVNVPDGVKEGSDFEKIVDSGVLALFPVRMRKLFGVSNLMVALPKKTVKTVHAKYGMLLEEMTLLQHLNYESLQEACPYWALGDVFDEEGKLIIVLRMCAHLVQQRTNGLDMCKSVIVDYARTSKRTAINAIILFEILVHDVLIEKTCNLEADLKASSGGRRDVEKLLPVWLDQRRLSNDTEFTFRRLKECIVSALQRVNGRFLSSELRVYGDIVIWNQGIVRQIMKEGWESYLEILRSISSAFDEKMKEVSTRQYFVICSAFKWLERTLQHKSEKTMNLIAELFSKKHIVSLLYILKAEDRAHQVNVFMKLQDLQAGALSMEDYIVCDRLVHEHQEVCVEAVSLIIISAINGNTSHQILQCTHDNSEKYHKLNEKSRLLIHDHITNEKEIFCQAIRLIDALLRRREVDKADSVAIPDHVFGFIAYFRSGWSELVWHLIDFRNQHSDDTPRYRKFFKYWWLSLRHMTRIFASDDDDDELREILDGILQVFDDKQTNPTYDRMVITLLTATPHSKVWEEKRLKIQLQPSDNQGRRRDQPQSKLKSILSAASSSDREYEQASYCTWNAVHERDFRSAWQVLRSLVVSTISSIKPADELIAHMEEETRTLDRFQGLEYLIELKSMTEIQKKKDLLLNFPPVKLGMLKVSSDPNLDIDTAVRESFFLMKA